MEERAGVDRGDPGTSPVTAGPGDVPEAGSNAGGAAGDNLRTE